MFGVGSALFIRLLSEAGSVLQIEADQSGPDSVPVPEIAETMAGLRGLPGSALPLFATKQSKKATSRKDILGDGDAVCFTGKSFVAWIVEKGYAKSSKDAVILGNRMIQQRIIGRVSGRGRFHNSNSEYCLLGQYRPASVAKLKPREPDALRLAVNTADIWGIASNISHSSPTELPFITFALNGSGSQQVLTDCFTGSSLIAYLLRKRTATSLRDAFLISVMLARESLLEYVPSPAYQNTVGVGGSSSVVTNAGNGGVSSANSSVAGGESSDPGTATNGAPSGAAGSGATAAKSAGIPAASLPPDVEFSNSNVLYRVRLGHGQTISEQTRAAADTNFHPGSEVDATLLIDGDADNFLMQLNDDALVAGGISFEMDDDSDEKDESSGTGGNSRSANDPNDIRRGPIGPNGISTDASKLGSTIVKLPSGLQRPATTGALSATDESGTITEPATPLRGPSMPQSGGDTPGSASRVASGGAASSTAYSPSTPNVYSPAPTVAVIAAAQRRRQELQRPRLPRGALEWEFIESFGDDASQFSSNPVEDQITAVEFNQSGEFLAIADRLGRVSIVQEQTVEPEMASVGDLSISTQPVEYRFYAEFCSHTQNLDFLKNVYIMPQINAIRWLPPLANHRSLSLLTANDRDIKLWRLREVSALSASGGDAESDEDPPRPSLSEFLARADSKQENLRRRHPMMRTKWSRSNSVENSVAPAPRVRPNCVRTYTNAHDYDIHSVSICSDGQTFLSSDEYVVNMWNLNRSDAAYSIVDMRRGPEVAQTESEDLITAATFHPVNCNNFALGFNSGVVKLCDMRVSALHDRDVAGAILFEPPASRASADDMHWQDILCAVQHVTFSQDGNIMATRDYLTVRLWDVRLPERPLSETRIQGWLEDDLEHLCDTGRVLDPFQVSLSPDLRYLVTGSYFNSFCLHHTGFYLHVPPAATQRHVPMAAQHVLHPAGNNAVFVRARDDVRDVEKVAYLPLPRFNPVVSLPTALSSSLSSTLESPLAPSTPVSGQRSIGGSSGSASGGSGSGSGGGSGGYSSSAAGGIALSSSAAAAAASLPVATSYFRGQSRSYNDAILKTSWHPRNNVLAVTGTYKMYLYQGRPVSGPDAFDNAPLVPVLSPAINAINALAAAANRSPALMHSRSVPTHLHANLSSHPHPLSIATSNPRAYDEGMRPGARPSGNLSPVREDAYRSLPLGAYAGSSSGSSSPPSPFLLSQLGSSGGNVRRDFFDDSGQGYGGGSVAGGNAMRFSPPPAHISSQHDSLALTSHYRQQQQSLQGGASTGAAAATGSANSRSRTPPPHIVGAAEYKAAADAQAASSPSSSAPSQGAGVPGAAAAGSQQQGTFSGDGGGVTALFSSGFFPTPKRPLGALTIPNPRVPAGGSITPPNDSASHELQVAPLSLSVPNETPSPGRGLSIVAPVPLRRKSGGRTPSDPDEPFPTRPQLPPGPLTLLHTRKPQSREYHAGEPTSPTFGSILPVLSAPLGSQPKSSGVIHIVPRNEVSRRRSIDGKPIYGVGSSATEAAVGRFNADLVDGLVDVARANNDITPPADVDSRPSLFSRSPSWTGGRKPSPKLQTRVIN